MRTDILNQEQKPALALLKGNAEVGKFYLAGGTALALHFGHRYSEDFDFFIEQPFNIENLLASLQQAGNCEEVTQSPGTLFLKFEKVRCSFILYKYALLDPASPSPWEFRLVSVREIGAMKVMAIGGRGRRRDFIDLYFIARQSGLENVWRDFEAKYTGTGYDPYHFMSALTYFQDADSDNMPKMISPVDWNNVKKFFESEVKKIAP
jgi:predicted nucleotidyltransferase component of viral defense system